MACITRQLARRLWNLALPLRRRAAGRVEQYLDRHVQLWLDRTEHVRAEQQRAIEDVTLVADALVRELARLQTQIQTLEQTVAEGHSAATLHNRHRSAA